MSDESTSKPPHPATDPVASDLAVSSPVSGNPAGNDPAAADLEMPPLRLTRTAKIVTVAVTVLGVIVTLYFDLPQLPGYAITFVTATLVGALTHRLTQK